MASQMHTEPDAEIFRLRTVLRDLVAVSTIPVAWLGRQPGDIAVSVDSILLLEEYEYQVVCQSRGRVFVEGKHAEPLSWSSR